MYFFILRRAIKARKLGFWFWVLTKYSGALTVIKHVRRRNWARALSWVGWVLWTT